ncbi:DUF1284 domain-containing protein [Sedimentitalea todarodis]|uniref:DUF1284 domain-containing protein n=1 Tax=Sedimentitalea todarodis TaxID=1631240 RepID=A0ABU3VIB7_9RHOB|nr:DUF1284 domain-containing protein [Sedimentitalea todarodis]MDU9005895.1 DUF1284 domain-containing protein [Sedimentitalea todarodis]
MTVRLRAHHLLCILTYVGRGYSPAFTENMNVIAGRIAAGESIEIVAGPDDICAPRLDEADMHCFDNGVYNRDLQAARDVSRILHTFVHPGAKLSLDTHSLRRLRVAFAQGQVRSACSNCQWGELCTAIAENDYDGTFV